MRLVRHTVLLMLLSLAPRAVSAREWEEAEPEPGPLTEAPGLPPPAAAEEGSSRVRYDKGFVFESEDGSFELGVQGRVQARWEAFSLLEDSADDELAHRFLIPRLRLTFDGHAFSGVGYKVQVDFGKGNPSLKDASSTGSAACGSVRASTRSRSSGNRSRRRAGCSSWTVPSSTSSPMRAATSA